MEGLAAALELAALLALALALAAGVLLPTQLLLGREEALALKVSPGVREEHKLARLLPEAQGVAAGEREGSWLAEAPVEALEEGLPAQLPEAEAVPGCAEGLAAALAEACSPVALGRWEAAGVGLRVGLLAAEEVGGRVLEGSREAVAGGVPEGEPAEEEEGLAAEEAEGLALAGGVPEREGAVEGEGLPCSDREAEAVAAREAVSLPLDWEEKVLVLEGVGEGEGVGEPEEE